MAWSTYEGDVWVCDACAFSFPKEHKDEGGGYSCPVCAEARLRAALENVRAELGMGTTPHVAMRIISSALSEGNEP